MPSLTQLEEAVDAFVTETKFDNVIVVVDATFGHRITPKERRWFDELVATNKIITPPAGAIGRGDAFILQIATRASATVLSNDSFQEFHGTHTWLFDEGRLFGGKPVPHIGWVFVSRAPVRGPTSRRAVKKAKDPSSSATTEHDTTRSRASDTDHAIDALTVDDANMAGDATKSRASSRRGRTRDDDARRVDVPVAMSVAQPTSDIASRDASQANDESTDSDAATDTHKASKRRSRRGRKSSAEIARSTEPVFDRKFNETHTYQGFRDEYPIGSILEVIVDRFSSHGAYAKTDDIEVYVPTKALGDPPPARARDVLTLGQPTLVAIDRYDDDACGIDVRAVRVEERDAYYASARASSSFMSSISVFDDIASEGSEQPTRRSEPVATKKATAKKAPAKKAPAKKAPAKKAVAKKAPAKKAVAKKAPAKKAVAKKAPAKKAVAKKAVAKKAPAKKAPAKKAPAKKAVAKKAPAKKKK